MFIQLVATSYPFTISLQAGCKAIKRAGVAFKLDRRPMIAVPPTERRSISTSIDLSSPPPAPDHMWVHYLVRNALVYCRGCLRLLPQGFPGRHRFVLSGKRDLVIVHGTALDDSIDWFPMVLSLCFSNLCKLTPLEFLRGLVYHEQSTE